MSIRPQIAELQERIRELQLKLPGGSSVFQSDLRRLQLQLVELRRNPPRRRPRFRIVRPRPPCLPLSAGQAETWENFSAFHRSLLMYSGRVNRDQWLQLTDVAADMAAAHQVDDCRPGPRQQPEQQQQQGPEDDEFDEDLEAYEDEDELPEGQFAGGAPLPGMGWDGRHWVDRDDRFSRPCPPRFPRPIVPPLPPFGGPWAWDGRRRRWIMINNLSTPLTIYQGGTGATTLAQARENLQILRGITNGSNARPGEIGEFQSAENQDGVVAVVVTNIGGTVTGPQGWVSPCAIGLAPGDWDVSGTIVGTTPATVAQRMYVMGALSTDFTGPTDWPTGFVYVPVDPPQESTSFFCGIERFNLTEAKLVFLLGRLTTAGGTTDTNKTGIMYGDIMARRVR